jgi:dynein light chain 1
MEKLEQTILNELVECEQLSLSSNRITNMVDLDLSKLKILSLSRNLIKKIVGVDTVRGTLQELWLSYNNIDSLSGLSRLENLEVL